ncbi:calpain-1 catalytic subunit-like [Salminus brasiliensis]|uniref:calpain-1 catalytic subunit-like n=1 Tax=Salminus brasiliensis TaxID=930266 RepID=UPI003B82C756
MSGAASTLAKARACAAGLGTESNVAKYLNQDFEALKSHCLSSGQLFCDPTFPAAPESLGFKELGPKSYLTRGVQWKRPADLFPDPQFIVGGATRTDICQGKLGNCWLMASIASLTLNQEILARVIYPEQSFTKDYAGIFHFKLWQYGKWMDVVVDDLLPVRSGKLLFNHSADGNEFWSALLEKACAKVNGCYEALKGGNSIEGFEDFTGGIAECYELSKAPSNLFNIIRQALSRGSLMCTSIFGSASEIESVTAEQLVKTHAYSITAAEEVQVGESRVQLVRLRNPWGHKEWNGPWSDNSSEWDSILPEEKAKLSHSAEDGEFWMAYSDYKERYSMVEICNLTPDTLANDQLGQWAFQQFEGSWKCGSSAGGSSSHKDTFWINPQYRITLLEEDDDPVDNEVACSFLLALMQKDRRHFRKLGQDIHSIGYCIYKVPEEFRDSQNVCLNGEIFQSATVCASSEDFIMQREITARLRLPPGDYLVIPSTSQPGEEADFIVRVFTEKQSKIKEVDNEVAFTLDEQVEITEQDIDASFRDMFAKWSGEDKEISAAELKSILNEVASKHPDLKSDGFSLEACRCMVHLMDKDGSARLGIVEFQILWNKITKWLDIFQQFDQDKSGTMNSYELRLALEAAGFKLNNKLNQMLVARYAAQEVVDFDSFICCLVKLEAMLRVFQQLDTDKSGVAKLNVSEWLHLTMYE